MQVAGVSITTLQPRNHRDAATRVRALPDDEGAQVGVAPEVVRCMFKLLDVLVEEGEVLDEVVGALEGERLAAVASRGVDQAEREAAPLRLREQLRGVRKPAGA